MSEIKNRNVVVRLEREVRKLFAIEGWRLLLESVAWTQISKEN